MKTSMTSFALVASLFAAAPLTAQETITLTTWGTGALIQDELGLFGTPSSTRVSNLPFSLSISLDAEGMQQVLQPGDAWFQAVEGLPGSLTATVTVNGQAWQWRIVDPRASAFFSQPENRVEMFTSGIDKAQGLDIYAHEVLNPDDSAAQFVHSDDYRDTVEFTDVINRREGDGWFYSSAYFWVTGSLPCATCPDGVEEAMTWFVSDEPNYGRWIVSAVPEPSGWMLWLGGAGLFAAARRYKLLASAR